MVLQWSALYPHRQKVPGSNPSRGISVYSLYVSFSPHARLLVSHSKVAVTVKQSEVLHEEWMQYKCKLCTCDITK